MFLQKISGTIPKASLPAPGALRRTLACALGFHDETPLMSLTCNPQDFGHYTCIHCGKSHTA